MREYLCQMKIKDLIKQKRVFNNLVSCTNSILKHLIDSSKQAKQLFFYIFGSILFRVRFDAEIFIFFGIGIKSPIQYVYIHILLIMGPPPGVFIVFYTLLYCTYIMTNKISDLGKFIIIDNLTLTSVQKPLR